jgi:pimeloyl-ACP methyl ester carboxylesterase
VKIRAEKFTNHHAQGVVLHALHWGDESLRTLVLLHGGGANAHWWDHLAEPIAASHHTVALDFRGHGDSDHPDELKVGAFNDDLEALCEHLGTWDVVLVGHSMGAHVALDHASRHPETRALVLIDPARGGGKRPSRVARLALSLRRNYRSFDEAVDRYRFVPGADHVEESLRANIARQSVGREGEDRWGFKFDPRWFGVRPRPRPDLGNVRCPTLVVRGEESTLCTMAGAMELTRELPHGRVVEIPAAGHHVQLDQPAAVSNALETFLSALEGSA